MGGVRGPGDKRVSSAWGSFLSNVTFPWFVGLFRSKKNQMSAVISRATATPPRAPAKEVRDMRMAPSDLLTTNDWTCVVCGTGGRGEWVTRMRARRLRTFRGEANQKGCNGGIRCDTYQQELGRQ